MSTITTNGQEDATRQQSATPVFRLTAIHPLNMAEGFVPPWSIHRLRSFLQERTTSASSEGVTAAVATAAAPERALQLGFVDLGTDTRPRNGKDYPVVAASHNAIEDRRFPETPYRLLDIDLYQFFVDDMTDVFGGNEGLLRLQVSTRNPQDVTASAFEAVFTTDFKANDGSYAPTFLHRGVIRNVVIQDLTNLKIELYELDTDATEYYDKIKGVISRVPELKNLDILSGIPYLKLATNLFDGIVQTFGKNPDDHLWGELPVLEFTPTVAGAFLRDGIYVLMEQRNRKRLTMDFASLQYRDQKLVHKEGKRLSNHLLFGLRCRPYEGLENGR